VRTLLVIVTIIGLGTVVATLMIGSSRFEQTVVREPYETGLRWDAERKERERSGWQVSIAKKQVPTGQQALDIAVNDRSARPLEPAQVEVRFLRPFSGIGDRTFRAERLPSGTFRIVVTIPERGRWDLQIMVSRGDRRIIFEDAIYAE